MLSRRLAFGLPLAALALGFATACRESPQQDGDVGLSAMRSDPARTLAAATEDGRYRFLVAGHVYGRHGGESSGLFAPFREAWGALPAARSPDFVVFTGDVVERNQAPRWDAVDRDLRRFGKPTYLAPGNHDGRFVDEKRDAVFKRYGARSKAWRLGRDAFVCCDTPRHGGNIGGGDLAALKRLAAEKPRALFVFVHHLVWVDGRKSADRSVRGLVNSIKAGYPEVGTFDEEVLPVLEKSGARVFVIAGDVGAGSKIVEWQKKLRPRVHLLASGMGEHPHVGTFLLFDVNADGVRIETVPLRGGATRIATGRHAW